MKKWYSNGERDIQIEDGQSIPDGFIPGRKCLSKKMSGHEISEETKAKISKATKNRTPHNKGKKEVDSYVYYNDGVKSIRVKSDEVVPSNYVRGRLKRTMNETEKEQFNQKRRATCKEKYGNENYNNSEKAQETLLTKYGVSNVSQLKEVKEKRKNTNISKYGVDNVSKLPEIVDKITSTKISRYGKKNSFSYDEVLNKVIANFRENSEGINQIQNTVEPNLSFKNLLISNGFTVDEAENRERAVGKYRYDFCIDDILIEINPTATHNITFSPFGSDSIKNSDYHYNKFKNAQEHNYRCISVFDWDDKDKILELLKNEKEKVYARNCEVREVDKKVAKEFISRYHLQGYAKSTINLGLYCNNELVSIMTFAKPRYNAKFEFEIIRYCASKNIIGGSEKLFKHFIDTYNPSSIISYCDFSKFSGKTYEKLGFHLSGVSIGKHWYNMKTKQHITNNLLLQLGYDKLFKTDFGKGVSNEELMLSSGFVVVCDCGQGTYVWDKENN